MKHRSKRLLDRVRDVIRLKGYSVRTEEAYADWTKRFILFHDKRHPREMGYSDIKAFLLHLAVEEGVAASTHDQALNALLFLYREVLGKDLDDPVKAIRAKSAKRLPIVLSQHMFQVLQARLVGIVNQVDRVGHRVDMHLVHAVERADAVLNAAGAIGGHAASQKLPSCQEKYLRKERLATGFSVEAGRASPRTRRR